MIDHIDPRWEEGRNYQLVCGLDVALNLNEVDDFFNRSKSNRFLPYRGSAPVEPGEFHWFLDPATNDWSWQEFCGPWWMDKTQKLFGGAQPKNITEADRQRRSDAAKALCKTNKGRKLRPRTDDEKARISQGLRGIKRSPETRAKMAAAQLRRWNRRHSSADS